MRRVWKVRRDTSKRGYTAEQVLAELEKREPDSRDYIRPQREHADIVVQFSARRAASPADRANGHLNVRLVLRPTIPHPGPDGTCPSDAGRECGIRLAARPRHRQTGRHSRDRWQRDAGADRLPRGDHLAGICPECKPIAADQFGAYQDRGETRHSDPLALTQLLLTYHLLREYGTAARSRLFAPAVAAMRRVEADQVAQREKAPATSDAQAVGT